MRLNDTTRTFFDRMSPVSSGQMGTDMKAILTNPPDAAAVEQLSAIPDLNAQLRTTCVATMLSGGHATNALPQLAEANINCRVYPTETAAEVRDRLARVINDTTVEVLIKTQRPPTPPWPIHLPAPRPGLQQAPPTERWFRRCR